MFGEIVSSGSQSNSKVQSTFNKPKEENVNFGLVTKLSISESSKVDLVQSMSYQ